MAFSGSDMADPIRFYFDFASPYAWFASEQIDRVGAESGRPVEWRPILMWAVLKAHDIAAPMDSPARRSYLLHDMERSAAFYGMPYRQPPKLPLSSHLAARLYYATVAVDPQAARTLAQRIFLAFFSEQRDISDALVLSDIAAVAGLSAEAATEGMKGQTGRAALEGAVAQAVEDGVVGSPYLLVDGEGFFGVDRLPQLRWFLGGKAA